MEVYETHFGWIFSFDYQAKGIGFLIENTKPYYAANIKYKDELVKQEIDYEDLPTEIKTVVTATKGVLLHKSFSDLEKIRQRLQQNK